MASIVYYGGQRATTPTTAKINLQHNFHLSYLANTHLYTMANNDTPPKHPGNSGEHPPPNPLEVAVNKFTSVTTMIKDALNSSWNRQHNAADGPAAIHSEAAARLAAMTPEVQAIAPSSLSFEGSTPPTLNTPVSQTQAAALVSTVPFDARTIESSSTVPFDARTTATLSALPLDTLQAASASSVQTNTPKKRPHPLSIISTPTSPTAGERDLDRLFRSPALPETPSTPSSGEVKRKRGRPRKDGTSSPQTPSTSSSSGEMKRGRGRPRKDGNISPRTPITPINPSSTESQRLRGQPRTRFHPVAGRMPRPIRPQEQPNQDTNGVQKRPQPNQYTKKREAKEAALPPRPEVPKAVPADTCKEWPHLLSSGLDFGTAIETMNQELQATHSAPVMTCANTYAHTKPYHVCATCRLQGIKAIKTSFTRLLRNNLFPLCRTCSVTALQNAGVIYNKGGEQGRRQGCRCGTAWLCAMCQLSELEIRQAKAQAERSARSGISGLGIDGGDSKCAIMGMSCVCGELMTGREQVWKCVGCFGLVVREM